VEDQTSLLQGSLQEDSFEVVMRGYNKRQVDDYVLQCQHHIRDLAQRLALAEQEIDRVRIEASTALEKAVSKPVHEELSERLGQILRLANEEAERERSEAADEIAALRAQTLAETQSQRDQAKQESDALRQQVLAETDAQREQVKAETEALRERVGDEADALRQRAEEDAGAELERARAESERVLSMAREAAELDVAQAHSAAREVEEKARTESERLMLAAQERSETVIGEAERRANAINTVLGARLEILTTTHKDVVGRLTELSSTLVDVLGTEATLGVFDVPPGPAEIAARAKGDSVIVPDPFVQTAGEVAAAYESAAQTTAPGPLDLPVAAVASGSAKSGPDEVAAAPASAWDDPARNVVGAEIGLDQGSDLEPDELDDAAPGRPSTGGAHASSRRLDLSSVPDKSRH
jgi:hypothetical protein